MDLDFNIDNYTLEEIENFFKLTTPYSLNDITKSEKIIVALIVKDGKLNGEKKKRIYGLCERSKTSYDSQNKTRAFRRRTSE